MRQFSIRWNSGPNISCDPTKQYAVEISGPDNFCNPSGGLEFVDASTTEYQCSNWPPSSLGQTYTFRVAAINCENQTGDYSSPVRIDLQGILILGNDIIGFLNCNIRKSTVAVVVCSFGSNNLNGNSRNCSNNCWF